MNLEDYLYDLPDKNIAKYPLKDRGASKLLKYEKGKINHHISKEIVSLLPKDSLLVFNNTKVIPARLIFSKSTGAIIEIFILEPAKNAQREVVMKSTEPVQWQCMIRNLKKWKGEELELLFEDSVALKAKLIDREQQIVSFSWTNPSYSFAEVIEKCGKVPLPPYLHREATAEDTITYQTIYAQHQGAVAAPTAGLHFTPETLNSLQEHNFKTEYLTLHVSAGTFQPIKSENIMDHPMHQEEILLTKENIRNIIRHDGPIIPVGTTSMRTLESLYWFGVKLLTSKGSTFFIEKLFPYQEFDHLPDCKKSFGAVLEFMELNNLNAITGNTEIFIFPGYNFKVCDGIVTNFHLPGSTLILLISALIGDDWKKVYKEALNSNYRFLSYGDSSLLLP